MFHALSVYPHVAPTEDLLLSICSIPQLEYWKHQLLIGVASTCVAWWWTALPVRLGRRIAGLCVRLAHPPPTGHDAAVPAQTSFSANRLIGPGSSPAFDLYSMAPMIAAGLHRATLEYGLLRNPPRTSPPVPPGFPDIPPSAVFVHQVMSQYLRSCARSLLDERFRNLLSISAV